MTGLLPAVAAAVAAHGLDVEVLPCDPELADTAEFCDHYGFALDDAANTIIVTSKKVDPPLRAVCVVLGTTRLDVNKVCRERVVMGGGNRSSKLALDPRELLKLPGAEVVEGLANPLMSSPNPEGTG